MGNFAWFASLCTAGPDTILYHLLWPPCCPCTWAMLAFRLPPDRAVQEELHFGPQCVAL